MPVGFEHMIGLQFDSCVAIGPGIRHVLATYIGEYALHPGCLKKFHAVRLDKLDTVLFFSTLLIETKPI